MTIEKQDAFLKLLIKEEKELGEKIVTFNKGFFSDGFAKKVGDYENENFLLPQNFI